MSENIITKEYIKEKLGRRKRETNKGDYGKGLLFAGSDGFFGAALMASASALRSGIGTLKTASAETARNAFFTLPEAMFCSVGESWDNCNTEYVSKLIEDADVIAMGPGIGRSSGVETVLDLVLKSGKNMVIDADALNVLSTSEKLIKKLHQNVVLTPHVKEMSRLIKTEVEFVSNNMKETVIKYAKEWNCIVLLKGAYSYIASYDGQYMQNISGNAGLAKGGSGDVLTGIILAMLGQNLSAFDSACAGAYILGASAENAFDVLQERMLLPRDVIEAVEMTLKWK